MSPPSDWKPKENEFFTHRKTREIVRIETVSRSEYIYVVSVENATKRWRTSLTTFRKFYRLTHPSELKRITDKPPPF